MVKYKVNQLGFLQIWRNKKWRLEAKRAFNAGDEVKIELSVNPRYFMICRVLLYFAQEKIVIFEVVEFWKNGQMYFVEK